MLAGEVFTETVTIGTILEFKQAAYLMGEYA